MNERLKLSFAIFEGYDQERVVTGSEALALETEINDSLQVPADVREITGSCAFPGQVTGTAVRIDNEDEMGKFKEGDIIVSTSTTPKLIPIMKKAKAIITDSGGITSHAAIVSRELQVPCVIGTKIASRVLKDGDEVEVDATKGIIKKV